MFFWLHCWRRMARLWKYAYWLLLPNFQDDWVVGHNSKKQFSSSRNCTGTPGSFDLFLPGGQLTLELPRYLRYNPSTVTYIYTCPIYIDWDCWMDGQTDRQTCMHAFHSCIHPVIHPYLHYMYAWRWHLYCRWINIWMHWHIQLSVIVIRPHMHNSCPFVLPSFRPSEHSSICKSFHRYCG